LVHINNDDNFQNLKDLKEDLLAVQEQLKSQYVQPVEEEKVPDTSPKI
jgi:hypothetical protein